ncbi:hypothetical protein [Actinomycetospora straminea]|uniref:Uncharacterized protein n=1 Tax=Actinomycetospora straminea TaxID=663607 RepID=A0ABP9EQF7_9PSEU|nr:hypothetical protein [Actinomycetospora straminea]MDD7933960.1 hypothetical protein [Actinomycetospora straminea]
MTDRDDPDFLHARCPLTGVTARGVATWVLMAERRFGGEIVPMDGAPLEEQIARAADNVRRLIAIAGARRPDNVFLQDAREAVEASDLFCVAVALSADELESRVARRAAAAD